MAIVVIILIFVLVGGLGYFIFQNQKLIKSLSSPSPSTKETTSPSVKSPLPSAAPSPTMTLDQLKENIEAAINSKNFAALATYVTTPKVNFSIMSTECCQPMTPNEAAEQMNYIKDDTPLDFDQNSQIVKNIKIKKPEYANAYIGVSKTGEQTAIFTINANNKISAIQLSASYKFYDF